LSVQAPNGNGTTALTSYSYNSLGQQTQVLQPSVTAVQSNGTSVTTTPKTTYAFDALGDVIQATDPNGNYASTPYSTTYAYNSFGDVTSVTPPTPGGYYSVTTQDVYNLDNELIQQTDPEGNLSGYGYDDDGRRTSVTKPNPSTGGLSGGLTTHYGFDANGNTLWQEDPLGNFTNYVYNARNQLIATALPPPSASSSGGTIASGSPTTSYSYDANGNTTAESDPDGNTTYYNYDALNRMIAQAENVALSYSASGGEVDQTATTYYSYDQNGNLTQKINADGLTENYQGTKKGTQLFFLTMPLRGGRLGPCRESPVEPRRT